MVPRLFETTQRYSLPMPQRVVAGVAPVEPVPIANIPARALPQAGGVGNGMCGQSKAGAEIDPV